MRRSTFPGAKSCFCPATSSIVFGLNLSANGEFIFLTCLDINIFRFFASYYKLYGNLEWKSIEKNNFY